MRKVLLTFKVLTIVMAIATMIAMALSVGVVLYFTGDIGIYMALAYTAIVAVSMVVDVLSRGKTR